MTMARDCISSVILLGVSLSGSVGCFYGLWVVAGVGSVWCSWCGILGVSVAGSSCNTWIPWNRLWYVQV